MSSEETTRHSVLERVLTYTSVTIIAVAVLSYITTLIVAMVAGRTALVDGLWPFVTFISFWGLPFGFVLLMVLLGINFSRRSKAK